MSFLPIYPRPAGGKTDRKPLNMNDDRSVAELDRRIAILRDNINQLIEQAAARSGAADEALTSDRIAQQSEELERLTRERDALLAAQGRQA